MKTVLGYEIEETKDPKAPYILRGKRGAVYGLLRHNKKPEYLYPVNLRNYGAVVSAIKGNSWFTDKSGILEPVS